MTEEEYLEKVKQEKELRHTLNNIQREIYNYEQTTKQNRIEGFIGHCFKDMLGTPCLAYKYDCETKALHCISVTNDDSPCIFMGIEYSSSNIEYFMKHEIPKDFFVKQYKNVLRKIQSNVLQVIDKKEIDNFDDTD